MKRADTMISKAGCGNRTSVVISGQIRTRRSKCTHTRKELSKAHASGNILEFSLINMGLDGARHSHIDRFGQHTLQIRTTTLATPQRFLEAVALVQSRALLLKIPRPIGRRRLLVPGLDLSNHAERPSALYAFSPTRGGVVRLHATRWLEPGDAVTIRYGDFDNAHFAQQYGFVPAANKLHAVRVPLRCVLPPRAAGEGGATGAEGAAGEGGAGTCSVEVMFSKEELMKPCRDDSSSWMLALNSRKSRSNWPFW